MIMKGRARVSIPEDMFTLPICPLLSNDGALRIPRYAPDRIRTCYYSSHFGATSVLDLALWGLFGRALRLKISDTLPIWAFKGHILLAKPSLFPNAPDMISLTPRAQLYSLFHFLSITG